MRADVLVIGSGASGAGAALAAARAGARVVVVRRGYGGTALSSGAVRLDLPPWLPSRAIPRDEVEDLLGDLFPLASLGGRRALLTVLGTTVEADMAFVTQALGVLDRLEGKRLAVVGWKGMTEVRPGPVARGARAAGVDAEPLLLAFPEAKHAHDLTSPELARLADDPAVSEALATAVADATAGFDFVALPPVLGLRRWAAVSERMDQALGAERWFELVASLPSVPGMRIQAALDKALGDAGIGIVHGRVSGIAVEGPEVRAVRVQTGEAEGETEVEALEVVLATGGLVGRGLRVEGTNVSEAVLGLPLHPTGTRPGAAAAAPGPFTTGLRLDAELRPVDLEGRPAAPNVRAAGEVAGLSYGAGVGGLAVSLATGWAAGAAAAVAAATREAEALVAASFGATAPDGDPSGCLNCGLCLSRCPTVRALATEKQSYPGPRGMMSGLTRFETELGGVADELSLCTLCGACSAVCPAGVPVPQAITRARRLLGRTAPEAAPAAYGALQGAFAKPGKLFEAEPLEGPRKDEAEAVLFVGCSLPYYERDHAVSAMKLLDALGVDYTLIDEVCCGGPLEVIGAGTVEALAAHNVAEMRRVGAKRVITCCPRCAATMVENEAYGEFEVEHTTTLLARLLPGSRVASALREKLAGQVVTFHDPCERARLSGEVEHAREAMAAVGLDLREMPRSGTFTDCCGAGGGVRAAQTKTSLKMARLRVSDAIDTGAPVLLTECPSCLHNLYNGRKRNQKIDIFNLTSFLGGQL